MFFVIFVIYLCLILKERIMKIIITSIEPYRVETTCRGDIEPSYMVVSIHVHYDCIIKNNTLSGEIRLDPEDKFSISSLKNTIKQHLKELK